MLISGEYVWTQFQRTTIEDWAACAVQYTRALEYELHRRFYDPCGIRQRKSRSSDDHHREGHDRDYVGRRSSQRTTGQESP